LPPGSVVFTGSQKVEKVAIHYARFDTEHIHQKTLDNQGTITLVDTPSDAVQWYDLRGLHDTKLIEAIGKTFSIHPLILEDLADISQRAKFEEYEKGNFFIVHALHFHEEGPHIKTEQVGIYFRKGLVLTFQETESDLFHLVRERLKQRKGRIRERGAEYLVYALVDVLVDHYFAVIDKLELKIEDLEDQLDGKLNNNFRETIHHLKKELVFARKQVLPLREAINRFSRMENDWMDSRTHFFIRDLYDHSIEVIENTESLRDRLHNLQDMYLSEISYKMNQIMQVLTVITTIFVPISFLAGVYGMNFEYMPELKSRNGYFILIGVMASIVLGFLSWFRYKKWL